MSAYRHTIIAPCRIVVTFQEKLDEVSMVAPGRSLLRLRLEAEQFDRGSQQRQ